MSDTNGLIPSAPQLPCVLPSHAGRTRNSFFLPSIISSEDGGRNVSNVSLPLNLPSTLTIPELVKLVERQRKELQNGADGIKAVQRNFERLSEIHNKERAELEKMRSEVQELRGRDASSESERKMLVAMRKELESLLRSHKELQEKRLQEQAVYENCNNEMQQVLEERDSSILQLKNACEQHQCADAKNRERLRHATALLNDLTRRVLQFATEVRARVSSLSVDGLPPDHSSMGRGGNTSENCSGGGSGDRVDIANDVGDYAITSALSNAWDSVDALCVAWRKAQQANERSEVSQAVMMLCGHVSEAEADVRRALLREEAVTREALCTAWDGVVQGLKQQSDNMMHSSLLHEELTRVRHEMQEKEYKHRKTVSALERSGAESHAALERARHDYAALQRRCEKDASAHSFAIQQQTRMHQEELKRQEEQHRAAEAFQERKHEFILEAAQQKHMLALETISQHLQREYTARECVLHDRLSALKGEICKLHEEALAASNEKKRMTALHTAVCESFVNKIRAIECAQIEMLQLHESALRDRLHQLEESHCLALQQQARDHQESVLTAAAVAFTTSLRAVEVAESKGRLTILLEEDWITPIAEYKDSLSMLRLQEAQTHAEREKRLIQRASRDALQSINEELTDLTARLNRALQENSQLSSESHILFQRLQTEEEASRSLRQALVSARALMQHLLAAEEASESAYSCGHCLQLYIRPMTCVPCGHTFCESCLLQHPQNITRSEKTLRFCPECRQATCNTVVRVRALETLSGNFCFRKKDTNEMQRIIASLPSS